MFLCHHADNSKKLFSRLKAAKAATKPFARHIMSHIMSHISFTPFEFLRDDFMEDG